jgi:hypothetical protein
MKMTNKILTVFLVLFACTMVFAETPPPPATAKNMGANQVPPPPPEGPIDGSGLLVLMLVAILLGIYVLYKYNLKTKASA